MATNYAVIASLSGYGGERLLMHSVKGSKVYMTIEDEGDKKTDWFELRYKIVNDGVYNQSVKNIPLPYIVYKKDVYSINDFHEWKRG